MHLWIAFALFALPFAAKAQSTSLPAIPHPRARAPLPLTQTPPTTQPSVQPAQSSVLPPVGTLCTTRIETQIYAPTPPNTPSHRRKPPTHNNTPRLHIRATYQMAVVSSDAAGYIVEGQTTEYTPLRVMGRLPNDTLKGLLSVYVGAMWRVHLDASNNVRSIHYGQPTEHTNKHKKSTERAIQLIFLRWPAPPHRPLRRWRTQHTTQQSGSFPCTETRTLHYKLNRRKGPHLTLQSTLRQNTRCSDAKRTLQSQSTYQGTVHLTYQRLQQRAHWRGTQSDTVTTHAQPTPAHTNTRPLRIDVHTTCSP